MSDFSQILKDLKTELSADFLEEVITVKGRTFKLKLLNDAETGWAFSQVNTRNEIGLAVSVRRATLAIGIREVDGSLPSALFEEALSTLSDDEIDKKVEDLCEGSWQLFYAYMMLEFLKELPSTFIDSIYEGWKSLEERRSEAQGNIKNS